MNKFLNIIFIKIYNGHNANKWINIKRVLIPTEGHGINKIINRLEYTGLIIANYNKANIIIGNLDNGPGLIGIFFIYYII